MAFAGRDHEIWARSAIVEAPAVEPVAVPEESANTPASQEMGVVEATATLEYSTTVAAIAETSVPPTFDAQEPRSQTTTATATPLLVSVLLALLVVGSVVLAQLTRTKRRV